MDAAQHPELVLFKKQGVRFGEAWFLEPAFLPSSVRIDVLLQQNVKQPPRNGLECHTLIFDLTKPEEELWNGIKQETRYKIRRAEQRDALTYEVYEPAALASNGEVLEEFIAYYESFAHQKGLPPLQAGYVTAMTTAGVLWLSCARKDGHALVWHSHVVNRGRARLRNSASHFRTQDSEMSNLIGRANRWLHWKDMLTFRNQGLHQYDFGGWYAGDEDEERLRINRFKEGFGGVRVKEYNGIAPVSLKGHGYLLARRVYHGLTALRRRRT